MIIVRKAGISIIIVVTLIVLVVIGVGIYRTPKTYQRTVSVMGTFLTVKLESSDPNKAEQALTEAIAEAKRIENIFSRKRQGSEIARINQKAAESWCPITEECMEILIQAKDIFRETGGAFDISVLPLIQEWGRKAKEHIPPLNFAIDQARSLVGSDKIQINTDTGTIRFLKLGMGIDLGALAKGYAVDTMKKTIEEAGCKTGLIEAGGDLTVFSDETKKKRWKIGLQHPRRNGELIGILEISDGAVATSGDYERFFMFEEKRYHHIIDPATGYPATACVSATVIAPTAAEADAYATAFFVMGPEKTKKFLKKHDDIEAVLITEEEGELKIHLFLKKSKFKRREK